MPASLDSPESQDQRTVGRIIEIAILVVSVAALGYAGFFLVEDNGSTINPCTISTDTFKAAGFDSAQLKVGSKTSSVPFIDRGQSCTYLLGEGRTMKLGTFDNLRFTDAKNNITLPSTELPHTPPQVSEEQWGDNQAVIVRIISGDNIYIYKILLDNGIFAILSSASFEEKKRPTAEEDFAHLKQLLNNL